MKRVLQIMMACIVCCALWISEVEISNEEIIRLGNLDKQYAEPFFIPDDPDVDVPENLFAALEEAADDTGSNLFRTVLLDAENGGYELVKYALLSNESNYLSCLEIEKGHGLTVEETRNRTATDFISTRDTDKVEQIGVIHSNMKNLDVTVWPLYRQFSYYKADGSYYVELADGVTLEEFLGTLAASVEKNCGVALTAKDFEGDDSNVGVPYADTFFYKLLFGGIGGVYFVILLYEILRETKRHAVMRLFGTGKMRMLWFFLRPFFVEGCVIFVVVALLATVWGDWLRITITALGSCVFVLSIMSFVFLALVYRIDISRGLKGERGGKVVYVLNTVVKMVCVCVVIYCGQTVYSDILESKTLLEQLSGWEDANGYGVFYPYYTGYDMSEREQIAQELAINYDLYKYLNDQGALYIDALQFEDAYLALNSNGLADWMSCVTVNLNYLDRYPLFDEEGNAIELSEEEGDWILLVPEKYRDYGDEIRAYYEQIREEKIVVSEEYYGVNEPTVAGQKMRLVWLCNGQRIFGFNTRVGTENGGWLDDVVVHVLTEENASAVDRQCVLGSGDRDPLKVKLVGDSRETYQSLSPILESLDLSDNLKAVVSVSESMRTRLTEIRGELGLALLMACAGLAVLVFFVIQNTILDFDYNRKRYIVKKMHGMSGMRIYGRQFVLSVLLYVVVTVSLALLSGGENGFYYSFCGICLVVVQFAASSICILRMEKRQISDCSKGA